MPLMAFKASILQGGSTAYCTCDFHQGTEFSGWPRGTGTFSRTPPSAVPKVASGAPKLRRTGAFRLSGRELFAFIWEARYGFSRFLLIFQELRRGLGISI